MNLPILNRQSEKPADGFYHLVPKGEFPGTRETNGQPRRITQVLDDTALQAMLNRFNAEMQHPHATGLRVDFDHFSYDPAQSSEAAGWIQQLDRRADGLWGRIDWTDTGDQAVTHKRFRLVSPVWLPQDTETLDNHRLRPLRLDSVALTNNPNLRGMVPLSNRLIELPHNPQTTNMKNLAIRLGLPAEAGEDAWLTAVNALCQRAENAERELAPIKNRVTDLETENAALLDEQLDGLLDGHGVKDPARRAHLKPVLQPMKNRADRVRFLAGAIGQDAPLRRSQPVLNRGDARLPLPSSGVGDDDRARAARQRTAIEEYRVTHRCTYVHAQNCVRRTKPELFGLSA